MKCGYWRLKCKSKSASKNAGPADALAQPLPLLPILPNDKLLIFAEFKDVGALFIAKLLAMLPPPELLLPVRYIGGTGISYDRTLRFELCIFTASDSDVKSGGKCVNRDSRVIFNEHNLNQIKLENKIHMFIAWIPDDLYHSRNTICLSMINGNFVWKT